MTATARLRGLLRRRTRKLLAPRPVLTVSEWAAQYRHLSREASAEPGRWDPTRNPVFSEVMDAMGSPLIETVVVMAASQTGKTEALLNLLGFMIDQQPGPALMVLPTLELGRAWALERFAPMVRDTAALRHRVADPKTRDSNTTILSRRFPGGSLTITGANAAAALSMRPVRWVLCDEVDRFPIVLAGEGSPVTLAHKRSQAFPNRKLILTSSPTLKSVSVIADWYERGDQRTYQVSCPDCAAEGPLTFDRLHWDKAADGTPQPETASWSCTACGTLVPEPGKAALIAAGRWVAAHPGRPIRSYQLTALASPFLRWEEIVRDFLESKAEPARLQVFSNTVLAEPWNDSPRGQMLEHRLADRLERYAAEVPAGVKVLTAGIDTQDNRLAVSVWGHGAKGESWLIHHEELMGSPAEPTVWQLLDQLLLRKWTHESGQLFSIRAAAIDTGGHHTAEAYRFVAPRQGRNVARLLALKGHRNPAYPHVLGKPTTANRQGVRLFPYGSAHAKDAFFAKLAVEQPGPSYVHLHDEVDKEFLNQLLAERVVYRKREGRQVRLWEKWRSRSEALDCALYAMMALQSLGRATIERLDAPAPEAKPAPVEAAPAPVAVFNPLPVRPPRPSWLAGGRPRNSWLKNW